MVTKHSQLMQRSPYHWAEMYARFYGELCVVVGSFLDDTIDRASLKSLYDEATKRHYDEIIGEVERVTEDLRSEPPE